MTFDDTLEYSFADDVETFFSQLKPHTKLSASQMLTALAGDAMELEDVFEILEYKDISLDISDLPVYTIEPQTASRLRREEELVKRGSLLEQLEEADPLRLYLEELAAIPAAGDMTALAQQVIAENDKGNIETPVHTQLMNLCLSRVVELACGCTGKGVLLTDLIQEASIGLWMALGRYSQGDFSKYRDKHIHRSLNKAVVTQAYEAGLGEKLRVLIEDYRSVDEKLLAELGRNPTLEEIAAGMHVTLQEAETAANMLDNARQMHRVKQPEPEELPQEENQAVEDTAYFQMRQRIMELMSCLSPEDAELLTLRYGLEGNQPLDAVKTAARLGLTPEEVNRRETEALMQLRQQ